MHAVLDSGRLTLPVCAFSLHLPCSCPGFDVLDGHLCCVGQAPWQVYFCDTTFYLIQNQPFADALNESSASVFPRERMILEL